MSSLKDPEWTEKSPTGRILDPLHLEPVRKRLLTDLLYGIVSLAVTQRIRYFSYYLWCLNNKPDMTDEEIVLLEKIYLLANISHEHRTKPKPDYNGLPGATSRTNDGTTQIRDLYAATDIFSLDEFQIHKGDSCGYFDYFRGPLIRLLLIDNKDFLPTPLGEKIGEEFGKIVPIPFDMLLTAANDKKIDKKTIDTLGDALCYCKIKNNPMEQDLLRKSFFYLIKKGDEYKTLDYLANDTTGEKLDHYLSPSADIIDYLEEELGQELGEKFLSLFNKGGFDIKMRRSLLLFLWLLQEYSTNHNKKQSEQTPTTLTDIQKMWKTFVYSEYMIFCVESFYYAILTTVKWNEGINEDILMTKILQHPLFNKTIKNLMSTETISLDKIDFLNYCYNRIYFDIEKTNKIQKINFTKDVSTIGDLRSVLSDDVLKEFDILSLPNEYLLKTFILKQRAKMQTDPLGKSAEIIAASLLLLFVLEQRYKRYFSLENFSKYWKWIATIEDDYFGPHELITQLTQTPDDIPISDFLRQFIKKYVINRSVTVFYEEKLQSGRVPLILSQDLDGSLYYTFNGSINDLSIQEKSTLKFQRLIDIFYGLGFSDSYEVLAPTFTEYGRKMLNLMIG